MSLAAIQDLYPWPESRPFSELVGLDSEGDGGGREMIDQFISSQRPRIMLEVGCFMGNSARRWMAISKDLFLICVDSWDEPWASEMASRGWTDFAEKLAEPNGAQRIFWSNLWEYRDRVVGIKGHAPEGLRTLVDFGIIPDIIYVDADNDGAVLTEIANMFPKTALFGDDWSWHKRPLKFDYPIRASVRILARQRKQHLIVRKETWMLSADRLSFRNCYDLSERKIADLLRPFRDRLKNRSRAK